MPEDQLPVRLPSVEGLDLSPKGSSPLGAAESWVRTVDPTTGEPALRDPDTMDTFVDSSWYYLRFLSPNSDTVAFDVDEARRWAPIDAYIGGVEHAILHLLYARFITKVLFDMGLIDFTEPFSSLINQGMVILDGAKMSKSKGNLVLFQEELDAYGADALRVALAFAGPVEDDKDWKDVSTTGAQKFLARALRVAHDVASPVDVVFDGGDAALRRVTHHLLADAPALVEQTKFNVVVARLMELVNAIRKTIDTGAGAADPAVREAAETVAVILDLVAPHTAEEIWEILGHEPSVGLVTWRQADPLLLVEDTATCAVQVNGKVRTTLDVPARIGEAELEALARADEGAARSRGQGDRARDRARPEDRELRRQGLSPCAPGERSARPPGDAARARHGRRGGGAGRRRAAARMAAAAADQHHQPGRCALAPARRRAGRGVESRDVHEGRLLAGLPARLDLCGSRGLRADRARRRGGRGLPRSRRRRGARPSDRGGERIAGSAVAGVPAGRGLRRRRSDDPRPRPLLELLAAVRPRARRPRLPEGPGALRPPRYPRAGLHQRDDLPPFRCSRADDLRHRGGPSSRRGAFGTLGYPKSTQRAVGDRLVQEFDGGEVWWSSGTGAVSVQAAFLAAYRDRGGAGGWLGLPTAEASRLEGGAMQSFQGGALYRTDGEDAIRATTAGDIQNRYEELGGPEGELGLPTGDKVDVPGGRYQSFAGGVLLWHEGAGVFRLDADSFAIWSADPARFGWPVKDSWADDRGTHQVWEKGQTVLRSGRLLTVPTTPVDASTAVLLCDSQCSGNSWIEQGARGAGFANVVKFGFGGSGISPPSAGSGRGSPRACRATVSCFRRGIPAR